MNAFKSIRTAGVPLCAIESADPAATILGCIQSLNGKASEMPLLVWDVLNGLRGINELGTALASEWNGTEYLGEALRALAGDKVPESTICFVHNAHRFLPQEPVMQGVWNLRDSWKGKRCHLVLLGTGFSLPEELKHDVVILKEPLPDGEALERIVESIVKDAGVPMTVKEQVPKIIDTLRGLSAFAAEQVLALSITKAGIDPVSLWDKKRSMIEQTPGLSVWAGGDTFQQIGGCDNVKSFLSAVLTGNAAPKAVVFIDEIEKSMAGSAGDSSGVSQDYLGTLLAWMQDHEAAGCIFVGPPGAAKSAVAKAAGAEGNIPTIAMDLGGMKGSLVGQSEQRLRTALSVVEAVAQGSVLFIATCNSLAILPPELKRRFTLGTFFFDLPSESERSAIWELYVKRYELEQQPLPNDTDWTGAEIKQACQLAWRLKRSIVDAARYIVPVAKSASDKIEQLRREAIGRFISASYPGTYSAQQQQTKATGRKIGL